MKEKANRRAKVRQSSAQEWGKKASSGEQGYLHVGVRKGPAGEAWEVK